VPCKPSSGTEPGTWLLLPEAAGATWHPEIPSNSTSRAPKSSDFQEGAKAHQTAGMGEGGATGAVDRGRVEVATPIDLELYQMQ